MRSVCDDQLGGTWIFPASAGGAFSRQIRGDAEFPSPSSYRHRPDNSFPEMAVRPKGAPTNLCDGSDTTQQSQLASTDTRSPRGLKPGMSFKQTAEQKIPLEMVLPKLRMGFLHPT